MLKTIFLAALLLTFPCLGFGSTYYVPDDYTTIQGAINSASSGDVIIVRSGTYYENLNYHGKNITLQSESGPEVTIIDGHQASAAVIFDSLESNNAILDGFTLTNGSGNPC